MNAPISQAGTENAAPVEQMRSEWIGRVTSLMNDVETWAKELGWSTRRIEKTLEDPQIGDHKVPALIMQEATSRVMLEPIGRSSSGSEGVVDLYLMPGYDDLARLIYSDDGWHLHNLDRGKLPPLLNIAGAPLSKDVFARVLVELLKNAA